MSPDMILGIVVGGCVAALVFVKALTWALIRAGEIVAGWFFRSL